jgi:hypothetical protein
LKGACEVAASLAEAAMLVVIRKSSVLVARDEEEPEYDVGMLERTATAAPGVLFGDIGAYVEPGQNGAREQFSSCSIHQHTIRTFVLNQDEKRERERERERERPWRRTVLVRC